MKYSTKLSDTIHILIFIALGDDEQLSSTKIAESIKTNPAYVRQLMATLKKEIKWCMQKEEQVSFLAGKEM